jgi:hypothetical protein
MTFTSIPHRVDAIMFDGSNDDKIAEFLGPENVLRSGGRFQVRCSGEPDYWRDLVPYYWISKDLDDGVTITHSPVAFVRFWQPE